MTRKNSQPQNDPTLAPLERGKAESDVRQRLAELVIEHGSLWRVAVKLELNDGYLRQIYSGKRSASNRYRCAFGLKPKTALAPVCPKHGIPHPGKCPRKKTFEQNAADYADWLKVNAGKLAEMVSGYEK